MNYALSTSCAKNVSSEKLATKVSRMSGTHIYCVLLKNVPERVFSVINCKRQKIAGDSVLFATKVGKSDKVCMDRATATPAAVEHSEAGGEFEARITVVGIHGMTHVMEQKLEVGLWHVH